MHSNNVSWQTFDELMRQHNEVKRCLHFRLEAANRKAGKLSHFLYGSAVGFVLAIALKGCM